MDKIKVLVNGCNGKMGQIVCRVINESEDMSILCGLDIKSKASTFPVFTNSNELEKSGLLPEIIIDFSKPNGTMEVLKFACNYQIPIVIATTGFNELETSLIKECSKASLIFQAANMSYSIALIEQVLRDIAPKLVGYDIEIVEIHHNRKEDSPSGTARLLAEAANSYLVPPMEIVNRREGKRNPNEIGISSLRGGNIVGTHSVQFLGESDVITINHEALSRDMFAEGALKAARYLLGLQENGVNHGLFSMKNML